MASKQAACIACRKSKIKCRRDLGAAQCEKCQSTGLECVIPSFHIGRQKGVKNKRTGLDKAIHQIEEAIKKSKSDALSTEGTLEQLQHLLEEARTKKDGAMEVSPSTGDQFAADRDERPVSGEDQLALDDAENPLQLLARASDLRITSPQVIDPTISTPSSRNYLGESNDGSDIHRFFLPMKASLDVGPDLDPIDLGLLTKEEAEMLMSFFHEKLAHTRWGLDPLVHTLSFVRTRSAFLFTSLLAASAIFIPATAALANRLVRHRKLLVQQLITKRYRSVEIVLGFMVKVPWMHPGAHAADDDTGFCISTALSIALDMSLNKIITPSWSFSQEILQQVPKADCIDAKKALAMDGFEDVEVRSEWGQRLLRRRERVWIALFVLERGVCLARGRSYCVPITPLVKYCDKWHSGGVYDAQDGPLISMAVLRRDLDDLFSNVRARCDSSRVIDVGSNVANEIETTIESFFNRWTATWMVAIGEGDSRTLPPYVEILTTHTRLSTYGGVMNHPTASPEVKRLFRASALSSALNVMRAAIQGEGRLQSMPNNTVIMICFAACVALSLSSPTPGGSHNLAPSVRNLIEETASVLERIGNVTSHRNGISILYGKYLRELVKQAPDLPPPPAPLLPHNTPLQVSFQSEGSIYAQASDQLPNFNQIQAQQPYSLQQNTWGEPFHFSAMSGNEVIETVMNAGDFEAALLDIPMEDMNAFAWMDWMNPPDMGFL
ncbi:hypothetical protein P154DRAFT_579994 [Amniculicola lignicola CBS 123094]|uniref:Zn(2)-C6 fungal-type domain-containing protein n=1 Tax=Amniculicola lignicola CBS 123094 TaxID=1392246 RepID=A0A6A5W5N6_9PLEO|nr:hypothetical protein P154DRAFT_579994 [Amniculicola lignicola CBS 123094]